MNAGYFLIQLASEKDKAGVYEQIGKAIHRGANGSNQVAFLGVINPLDPTVETHEQVCEDLVTATKHTENDQIEATDNCGFSPFSIDGKPKHGSPDFAREVAFEKISNRIKSVKMASEKLKI